MNSFISSFKPLLLALALIACFESTVFFLLRPDDVGRSNYFGFNYLTPEHNHRFIISEKLRQLSSLSPDIVQVGDSSGYFGVKPTTVMRYLKGLSYVNISCCANTGYDGYYAIADYMFTHTRSIKYLVLYISLTNLPRNDLTQGDKSTGDVAQSFDSVWADFMPPSTALRFQVTNALYNGFGWIRPLSEDAAPTPYYRKLAAGFKESRGWALESDIRKMPEAQENYWKGVCGDGIFNESYYHANDILGHPYSLPLMQYNRFAALAEKHNATLIIMAQPFPCSINSQVLQERVKEIAEIKELHPNVIVIPKGLFEHWPKEYFTIIPHLRTGYEEANSERVGRTLAAALGISPPGLEQPPYYSLSVADQKVSPVWQSTHFTGKDWVVEGAKVQALNSDKTELIEATENGWHRLMANHLTLPKSQTAYVFSILFKVSGARAVELEMVDGIRPGQYGTAVCNPAKQETLRTGDIIDADMEVLPDGWYRCWASMTFNGTTAGYSIAINKDNSSLYEGDGKASLILREALLQPGARVMGDIQAQAALSGVIAEDVRNPTLAFPRR